MQSMNYRCKSNESFRVSTLYNMARGRNIPINQVVKSCLNISDFDEKRCFTINDFLPYKTDNVEILKSSREKFGYTQKEVSRIIGCTESFVCCLESGRRKISDIRLMYNISKLYEIPLYVLIRNELGITDEELSRLISFGKNDESETKLNTVKENIPYWNDEFSELFEKIQRLSKSDLQILVFMKIAFESTSRNNQYKKLLNAQKSFELGKNILSYIDGQTKMSYIMELLKLM